MTDPQTWQLLAVLAVLTLVSWLIARSVKRKPPTADTVRAEQLRDAAVQALQWRVQAEHAIAMADMYAARVDRLSGPTYTPGPNTERVTIHTRGGGSGGTHFGTIIGAPGASGASS